MMIAQTSKAPMTMTNLFLNAAQAPKPPMATTANLLLTPPLLLIPPLMISALKYTQQRPSLFQRGFSNTCRSKKSFSYTPPTSSSSRPLSLRLSSNHAAVPITPVLKKENNGFGGNMNCADFWGPLSGWDDVVQKGTKFVCQWVAKEDNTSVVAETEDDTQEAKRKTPKTTRMSDGKLSRKIYMVMVGVSFCALVAFVPKQQASCCIVASEHLSRAMKDIFFCALLVCPLTRQLSYDSMKMFVFNLFVIAPAWINIWQFWYYHKGLQSSEEIKNRKPSKKQSITFDDVEGVDAAKAELLEIVLCIKGDSRYMKLGAKLPRGVLLAGPPGTGKTLLARAVAGEADVTFFSMSASEFVEVFAGKGAARVRNLFQEARKHSPSIIFIDEIDSVGGQRGNTMNSERDQTLNQLLTEMDGFEKGASVVVMAATNRPELLDSALMRPGRFSRKVVVGKPDEDGRRKIFALYLQKVPMKEDKQVICDLVASRTPGLVGADLENIANEAVLLAARRGVDFVTKEDVLQAVERATTKIYNDDTTNKANSPYLFGEMALESVHAGGC
ncbi:unnamed protein product [Lactuca saligna]|uniref:AAA+ ATPase domain-containing protein n=1 Tax=Lactuca saligna TaxID=75948 RepID=A0AA35Z6B2_LACSI|nr:unnamed protein product [Lactuca saligna]